MILHITKRIEWGEAVRVGEYRAASLSDQGFIHCSTTEQVLRVAEFFFSDQCNLVLLCIDEGELDAEVRYENLEGGQDLFPHVYGSINLDAVVNVVDFEPEAGGRFRLPCEIHERPSQQLAGADEAAQP